MAKFTKTQAAAIAAMGENLHGYNRGVLAMLGQEQLAVDYELVTKHIEVLVDRRNSAQPLPENFTFSDLLVTTPESEKIDLEVKDMQVRQRAAWAPIQAMIDDADSIIDAADPMGGRHW